MKKEPVRKQRPAPSKEVAAAESKLAAFARGRMVFVPASAILLIPCVWQSRLQAGDLSSHIYNAWLAQLIGQGRAPGLAIAPQTTNVLFDLILSALFRLAGAEAAQRIAVILAVLIFVWGAMAFVSVVSGRRVWCMLPIIGILAYGWVFHMGLFNFYLSLGLSLWALALAWEGRPTRLAIAGAILIVAYTAQALAPVWAVALLAYRWAAERVAPRQRLYLASAAVLAIVALHVGLARSMRTNWVPSQILLTTGADQAYVFAAKYRLVTGGLLLLWGCLLFQSLKHLSPVLFHLCILTAAGIFLLPTWVWLPHYNHALVFISERMSLAVGVLLCALVSGVPPRRWHGWAASGIAILFFAFLYIDERALNGFEDQLREAVSQLPAGQRVVSAIDTSNLRTNPVTHMIDRVCIGWCYSYANYEPSTAQFRIRVIGATPMVAPTDADSSRMQTGGYMVKPRDLPLFRLMLDQSGNIVVQNMPSGALTGMSYWNGL